MKLEHSYKGVNIYSKDGVWTFTVMNIEFEQDPKNYGNIDRNGQVKLAEYMIDVVIKMKKNGQ